MTTILDSILASRDDLWPRQDTFYFKEGDAVFEISPASSFSAEIPADNQKLYSETFQYAWQVPRRTAEGSTQVRRWLARMTFAAIGFLLFAAFEIIKAYVAPVGDATASWDVLMEDVRLKYGLFIAALCGAAPQLLEQWLGPSHFYEKIAFRAAAQGRRSRVLFFTDKVIIKPGTVSQITIHRDEPDVSLRVVRGKGLYGLEVRFGGKVMVVFGPTLNEKDVNLLQDFLGMWWHGEEYLAAAAGHMILTDGDSRLFDIIMMEKSSFSAWAYDAKVNVEFVDERARKNWMPIGASVHVSPGTCQVSGRWVDRGLSKLNYTDMMTLLRDQKLSVLDATLEAEEGIIEIPIRTEDEYRMLVQLMRDYADAFLYLEGDGGNYIVEIADPDVPIRGPRRYIGGTDHLKTMMDLARNFRDFRAEM